ncbi:MAG: hypothetical protein F6K37_20540, partial [Moorea sp. SIO4E2]|uniref:hemopexin repeat-containing protein n=1 Tax=Moorena sp. SIO4E2 TaxID=2607826 RepID=UPI0013BB562B
TKIHAAFTGKDGKTYFFSGNEYVRFSDKEFCHLDNGYPRTTNDLYSLVYFSVLIKEDVRCIVFFTVQC